ncbi:hypothetical protein HPP92_017285 [Vanilla planifolia]|uniref:Uncharacterized protein n=1 Tax=Vanilla planifolia TaxID=51239 RepID=A0A835QF43_VANPL|nr:hypothetical protein HPP92_017276 [Vanilla planifolia]KAG0467957.1 hypothetical protein HPP92_017285 [Vanilla planifolia]
MLDVTRLKSSTNQLEISQNIVVKDVKRGIGRVYFGQTGQSVLTKRIKVNTDLTSINVMAAALGIVWLWVVAMYLTKIEMGGAEPTMAISVVQLLRFHRRSFGGQKLAT